MRPIDILAPFGVAVLLFGCGSPKQKEPPPRPFAGTLWQVMLELPIQGEQPNMRFGDGRVEGFGGCSRFAARYVQDSVGARAIAIGRIEIDRRLCNPSSQAAETRVLEVLQSVSSYSITADTMTMSGSGGTLRFHAADGMSQGVPVPVAATPGGTALKGTRWMGVVDVSVDPRNAPWLEFVTADRVSGYTGCNMLSGTWRLEGGEVRLGTLMTTKRGCLGPAGDLEKRVLAAMSEQSRVTREGGKLVFISPAGARFEFTEAK